MTNYTTKKRVFKQINTESETYKLNFIIDGAKLIESHSDNSYICLSYQSTTKETTCKCCKRSIRRFKAYNDIVLNYGYYGHKTILLKIRQKKYHCEHCRKTTVENLTNRIGKRQESNEVSQMIIKDLQSDMTYTAVAKRLSMSVSTIIRRFDSYRKGLSQAQEKKKVIAVGVDEVSMIKSRFNKFQFVVVDHQTGNILDIIEGRKRQDVLDLLKKKYDEISFVSMDLWPTYQKAFKETFGNIVVIADRFHVVRIFMWAFSRSRIQLFKEHGITTTKHWKILTCRGSKLNDNALEKLDKIFDEINMLKEVYEAKELTFDVFKHQSVEDFESSFSRLKEYVYEHDLKEFYSAIKTVENWYEEICNMFIYGHYSNGRSERVNVGLKRMKALVYGFRNHERTFDLAMHKLNKIA